MSVAAITTQIRTGEVRASDLVERTLVDIEARDPALNCFTLVTKERARAEALAVEARMAAGRAMRPLEGVPYAVKNLFDIEGEVTLAGAAVNRDRPPAKADAVLVQRLKAAGAILVGALNMDEHAYGFTTENTHYGPTRNPHDQTRTAGGSSGGSGAAVAADLVSFTLASDTNGSIRVPSSFCGVFGLKPTFGRLPRTGSFPFVHGLDHLGVIGHSVDDLAASYDAMQGADANDASCVARPIEPVHKPGDVARLPAPERIATLSGHFERWAGPQAQAAVALLAKQLGVTQRCELKGAELARAAAFVSTASEAGAMHRPQLITRHAEYEPLSRDRLIAGALIPAAWLFAAQRLRAQVRDEALALFDQYDILLAAATPVTAPALGTEWLEINGTRVPARASIGLLTQPLSFIGLPIVTVPVWLDGTALPIGVQVIAAPWREDLCLSLAAHLERLGAVGVRPAVS